MAAARAVRPGKRVCLVFLDNNERSLLGASAFKKRHIDKASQCLFIDLDSRYSSVPPSRYAGKKRAMLRAMYAAFSSRRTVSFFVRRWGM